LAWSFPFLFQSQFQFHCPCPLYPSFQSHARQCWILCRFPCCCPYRILFLRQRPYPLHDPDPRCCRRVRRLRCFDLRNPCLLELMLPTPQVSPRELAFECASYLLLVFVIDGPLISAFGRFRGGFILVLVFTCHSASLMFDPAFYCPLRLCGKEAKLEYVRCELLPQFTRTGRSVRCGAVIREEGSRALNSPPRRSFEEPEPHPRGDRTRVIGQATPTRGLEFS